MIARVPSKLFRNWLYVHLSFFCYAFPWNQHSVGVIEQVLLFPTVSEGAAKGTNSKKPMNRSASTKSELKPRASVPNQDLKQVDLHAWIAHTLSNLTWANLICSWCFVSPAVQATSPYIDFFFFFWKVCASRLTACVYIPILRGSGYNAICYLCCCCGCWFFLCFTLLYVVLPAESSVYVVVMTNTCALFQFILIILSDQLSSPTYIRRCIVFEISAFQELVCCCVVDVIPYTHKLNVFGNYEKILRQCCSLWLRSPLSDCSEWKFLVSPTFADHQPLLVPLHLWGYNHAVQKLQLLADLCTIERGSKSAFSLLTSRGVTPAWRFTASVDFFKCQKKPCIFLCSSTEETWHCIHLNGFLLQMGMAAKKCF
jgi:hypothetical protein